MDFRAAKSSSRVSSRAFSAKAKAAPCATAKDGKDDKKSGEKTEEVAELARLDENQTQSAEV